MRGSVYQRCFCRDETTKRPLGRKCPDLSKKGHAAGWYYRYDAPRAPGEKRRQPEVGPFPTRKDAQEELSATLARIGGGAQATDRALKTGKYLTSHLAGKRNLKPRSRETDAEAFRLYWIPALGSMRLADVRDHHVSDVVTAMELINRPVPDEVAPEVSELLRRLYAARADDERRTVPEGEKRHKKSTRPLSPARIERLFAPFRAAMNAAVKTRKIGFSPCTGVELPRADHVKPLAWTPAREAKFLADLDKRMREAQAAVSGGRTLTTVERQDLWRTPSLRPAPSMVWMPAHAGTFLDYLDQTGERLAVLFVVTIFCGFRRDEVLGLTWAEADLEEGVAYVRETASGDGPKSDAGIRVVPLPGPAVGALKAWRKIQAAERLAWGPDWADTAGLVFTREDGTAVPAQWTSTRFETLAYRAGLPPVRFHDLRHGTASLMKAARIDTKFISAQLGHSRTSFTDAEYVSLFPEVQKAAAEAAAAIVPRRTVAKDS